MLINTGYEEVLNFIYATNMPLIEVIGGKITEYCNFRVKIISHYHNVNEEKKLSLVTLEVSSIENSNIVLRKHYHFEPNGTAPILAETEVINMCAKQNSGEIYELLDMLDGDKYIGRPFF